MLKKLLHFASIAAIASVFATHANAEMSEWQDLGGGKARLVASLDPKTAKVEAALEVRLEPGWSTYWRYPGSAGIPPIFDFSQSVGFAAGAVDFPFPKLLKQGSSRYAGYKKNVTFPLEGQLDLGTDANIELSILIGVCETICIPAQAKFNISKNELLRSDPRAASIVNLARKLVPAKIASEKVLVESHMAETGLLTVTVQHGDIESEPSLFVEGPADWYLTPALLVSKGKDQSTFSIDLSSAPSDSDYENTPLTYTLTAGSRSVVFVD